MFVLDIVPLATLPRSHADVLSYYHTQDLPSGTFVAITFGARKIRGVVLGSHSVRSAKLILKKGSDFTLKKIDQVLDQVPPVTKWQFDIARFLSSYYFAALGTCLNTVLPKFWQIKKYKWTKN